MTRFTVIQTSNFNGLNRFRSEGPAAMIPILQQRQDLGFNSLRDWTAFDLPLIGRSVPDEDLYRAIPDYLDLCAQFDLYVEITAFTGPYPFFPTQSSMIDHWERLITVLADCSNLLDLEAVNEGDNGPNLGVPLDHLRRPPFLASHGSNSQDSTPVEPHWDVAGYRSPTTEWWRKTSHNAMEFAALWNVPVWTNEFPRTDHEPNPAHWEDAGAAGALLCAGPGCFHAPEGKNATIFGGPTTTCAQAFVRGARSVPLEFQAGVYSRLEPNPPGVLRVYRRTLSDGRFHEVQVRA